MRSDIHVLPIDDTIEHVEHRGCWCRPRVDFDEALMSAAVIVHNSFDGREHYREAQGGHCTEYPTAGSRPN